MKQKSRQRTVPVKINRKVPKPNLAQFTDHFQGFENVDAVRRVFGDDTEEVLNGLKIGFMPNRQMYMGIRDNDGNLAIGTFHLKNSPTRTIYLDIVHELFHIGQWRKDKDYFTKEHLKFMGDRSLYYASPIEIPAYKHTVREAERIGMTEEEIVDYLKMGEAPVKVWRDFLKAMELGASKGAKRVTRFPVKIKREARSETHPFSDYFIGFEKVPAVKELFGDSTNDVLSKLRVEFIDSPWPMMYPSEEDGHLIVANVLMGEGTATSIYLDAFLCLNMIKHSASTASGPPDKVWTSPGMMSAYSALVREARRLGVSDDEIKSHMALQSFLMSKPAYAKFLKSLGLREE